ncbi:tyrosine-type recombinase/integrase [Parasutterella excrementihominis]|uniref:tyrosine-type recombinase/integrase n=1 Tax=Parasutterella excrementihominis TaxID=487175 RepID=UPI003AEFB487
MRAISDPNELKILTSLKQKRGYNPQNKDKIVKLQLSGYKGLYAELRGENLRFFLRYTKANGKKTDRVYKGLSLSQITSSALPFDRELIAKGLDPIEEQKKARQQAAKLAEDNKKQKITFEDVYLQWKGYTQKKTLSKYDVSTEESYKALRDMNRYFHVFEKHILPSLAKTPIYSITSYHLTEIFAPLYSEHYATANKCATPLGDIFSWYERETKGEFKTPITSSFAINLRDSRKEGIGKTKNFNAPDYRALPVIFGHLNSDRYENNTSALVTQFCILTACRGQAIRKLQWENVHLNDDYTGYFIIPKEDNKIKDAPKELRTVYFGSMVGALLTNLKDKQIALAPAIKYVFPNKYRKDWAENPKPLGENAINTFMRKTFHVNELKEGYFWKDADNEKDGLIHTHATSRACFQTWALEQKDPKTGLPRYSKELTEACLLHAKADQYKGAYDRSRVSEEELYRIKGDWEEYIFSYELACSKILPVLDNPIAMGNLRDEEAEIEQLEKQGQPVEESEDLKSYRIYERGLVALMKARDDFKKYNGDQILKQLEQQKSKKSLSNVNY